MKRNHEPTLSCLHEIEFGWSNKLFIPPMLQINSLYRINVHGDHQRSDTKQLDNIQLNKVHGYSTKLRNQRHSIMYPQTWINHNAYCMDNTDNQKKNDEIFQFYFMMFISHHKQNAFLSSIHTVGLCIAYAVRFVYVSVNAFAYFGHTFNLSALVFHWLCPQSLLW